jgi:hypothetical protein
MTTERDPVELVDESALPPRCKSDACVNDVRALALAAYNACRFGQSVIERLHLGYGCTQKRP